MLLSKKEIKLNIPCHRKCARRIRMKKKKKTKNDDLFFMSKVSMFILDEYKTNFQMLFFAFLSLINKII